MLVLFASTKKNRMDKSNDERTKKLKRENKPYNFGINQPAPPQRKRLLHPPTIIIVETKQDSMAR
jgi:hypothetical protein